MDVLLLCIAYVVQVYTTCSSKHRLHFTLYLLDHPRDVEIFGLFVGLFLLLDGMVDTYSFVVVFAFG